MYTVTGTTATSWFGARTVVAAMALMVALLAMSSSTDGQQHDGCRVECYPDSRLIHGKGGATSKGDNCRWILRTDGKPARLCDHIKCKKVCPNNQAASSSSSSSSQQQEAQQEAASDSSRIEQKLIETDSPMVANSQAPQSTESMGIMRRLHGNKLAKAPVPGVAGGRLAPQQQQPQPQSSPAPSSGQRRLAPTLAPSVQYDENDTPPPISRFLDISPEE